MAIIHKRIPEVVVPGKRLGRHYRYDERSLRYLAPEADPATLASVRHARLVPVLDQGDVGSCTGNAMVGAIGTDPVHAGLSALLLGQSLDEHLALNIYSQAEVIDGDGPYPPNDNGSSGTSVSTVAKSLGYIAGYNNAQTLAAALTALAAGPVIVGMNWLTGCDKPNTVGRISYLGSVRGGHEIVFDEIDVTNQLVWFTNSWGTSWGVSGRACMSWTDFGKALADEGDCIAPVPLSTPAPVPAPTPSDPDVVLWTALDLWSAARHVGANKNAATAVKAWAKVKGY